MRAYLSGLIVAFALLAAPQPAAAATCYDTCYQTCSYYTYGWYYDSCTGQSYQSCVGAPSNYVPNATDTAMGCTGYGTYQCLAYQCNPHTCPDQVVPELTKWMVSFNDYTGDFAFDQCSGNNGNYRPIAAINAYRNGRNIVNANGIWEPLGYAAMAVGVPNWPVRTTSVCQRAVSVRNASGAYYTKTDNFVSTNCATYGASVMTEGPTLLVTAYEGSKNKLLYLCAMTAAVYANGGTWQEYRVLDNCAGGYAVETLGYARYEETAVSGVSQYGNLGDNGECSAATCAGMCGVDCQGILGVKVYTGACAKHDQCVCNHGNNIWAWDCLGDFAVAAVSFVVAVVETIINAIIRAISNTINAILDFLFGWL